MKLFDLISVTDGDMVVHVIDEAKERTVFYGTILNAHAELDKGFMDSKVKRIYSGFGGLCIDVAEE